MKKKATLLLALALAFGLCLTGCNSFPKEKPGPENDMESASVFSGGTGTEDDPYLITTAAGLAAVSEDLTACYRLDADIDLSGVEWTPIGVFTHTGDETADPDMPDDVDAFTGIFDGGSHTISNLTVDEPEGYAVGLFGCLRDAHIYNLTLDGATVDGSMMTGAVAGYAYNSRLTAVSLTGSNYITGHNGDARSAEMIGGILGRGKNSLIDSCSAKANITLPATARNAGILCGDLDTSSVVNGYATGTLTAGDDCYGLGAVSGSGFGSEEFTNCTAENVRITTGDNARMVGGLTGYAGGYEDESFGVAVTEISRCTVSDVEITTGENQESVGGLIGGGFYLENLSAVGEPYDAPTVFTIADCAVSAAVNGEEAPLTGVARE